MNDAPASLDSKTMDELFPAEPSAPPQAASPESQPPEQPPAQPAATPDEPFIKGSRTVYKTREAAVEGLNSKDTLIEELRQRYSLATGIDPITRQPVGNQTPQASDNYDLNPKKYLADLQAATKAEDLAQVQKKFLWDSLQPIAPVIMQATKANAIQRLKAEVPDFETFHNSAEYQTTLERTPSLKEAIETAEGDIRFTSRLDDLYKTAYLVHQGIQLPELLKRQSSTTQPPATRPTNTPTTLAPDPNGIRTTSAADLQSREGRKSIIEQFEKSGRDKLPW
jgi:hypothetical protein